MTETTERTLELSPTLRKLVDERLDGIDRALRAAALPRGERVQVVEDVERQLLDMLADAGPHPSRRDVLQALAKLDPPEAYLSDEPKSTPAHDDGATAVERPRRTSETPQSRLALCSLAGLAVTSCTFLLALVGAFTGGEGILIFGLIVATCGAFGTAGLGVVAIVSIRREQASGTGFAVLAVVVSAWIIAVIACWGVAILFESELVAFLLLVLKDIPFGVALIWCLRLVIKQRD